MVMYAKDPGSVEHIWSVTPGAYAAVAPTTTAPELLLVARRP